MATQYSNKPIVTDGLVYALDFGNQRSYVSGSTTANSLNYSTTTGSFYGNLNSSSLEAGLLNFYTSPGAYGNNDGTKVGFSNSAPFSSLGYGKEFTLTFLIKIHTSTANQTILSGLSSERMGFTYEGGDYIFALNYFPDVNSYGRRYPATNNTLQYRTIRYKSGSWDHFVNGIPITASSVGVYGNPSNAGPITISGRGGLFQNMFTGSLGLIHVYNRALTSDEIWNNYQLTAPRYGLSPLQNKPYTLDENAYLFLQSAGITDPIITGSIDTFVLGLKSASLWDKMIAIYPFVGTGSTGTNLTGSHRWNLKEPSLVTYPLTFTGTWIGSTSGSAPSGSGTNITMGGVTPSTLYPNLATSSVHISILSYDTPVSSSYLMGTGMTEDLAVSTLAGDYGTPAAAYSVRKVRTAYSGALMDVRRTYDNTTGSIGYISNGDLDTNSLLDWVSPGRSTLPGAYSGLAAAYSLRRVSSSYTGSAIDVRRDSDNYIFPVGFTSSGDLDTQTLLQTLNTGSNIIPYSNDFTQARWNLTNTQITSSVILGPFGRGSGSFLNETSTNDIHRIFESFTTPTSSIHSISVFVKKQHRRYIALGSTPNSGNNSSVLFDLDTTSSLFTVNNGTGFQTITSSIHSVDDGWFRLSYVFRQGRDDVYPLLYLVNSPSVYTTLPPGYAGQPGTGSYIYGFQYTTGSILQPYIETTGSARFNQPVTNPMGYVTRWYDQSGNGRHATQTATGSQPLIVSSGSLITENGKPAINFIGANLCRLDSPSGWDYTTTFTTTRFYTRPAFAYIYNSNVNKLLNDTNGSGYRIYAGSSALFAGTDPSLTGQDLVYVLFSGSSSQIRIDNNSLVTGSLDTYTANGVTIGIAANNVPDSAFNGTMQELVFYSTNQSANRPLIENNINNYYNIYTGSNHGFVSRWYDQSGNNRHARQLATGSQPLIVLSSSVIVDGNRPALSFDGISQTISSSFGSDIAQPISIYSIYKPDITGSIHPIYDGVGVSNKRVLHYIQGSKYISFAGSTLISTQNTTLNKVLNTSIFNGASSFYNINSALDTSGNPGPNPSNGLQIGAWYDRTYYFTGKIQELVMYPTNQSSIVSPIEYGINTYYNIYTQPSASFATSSFTIKVDSGSISGSLNNRLTSAIATSGPLGFITVSRTGSNSLTIAKNGVSSSFTVPASGALSTGLYLGAINNNGIALGNSPLNIEYASVGTGLTNAEAGAYTSLVYNFRNNFKGYDRDAVNFINALGTARSYLTLSQQSSINTLVTSLKSNRLWDKFQVMYPFIGGTATSHGFNLKDPRRTTDAHYMTFTGGTNNTTGYSQNGNSSLYGLTNFNPSVNLLDVSSSHISLYVPILNTQDGYDFGTENAGLFGMALRTPWTSMAVGLLGASAVISPPAQGYFIGSRIGPVTTMTRFSGSSAVSASSSPVSTYTAPNINLNLGSLGYGATNRFYSFLTIGSGLTAAERATLNTIVETYQASLGRQAGA